MKTRNILGTTAALLVFGLGANSAFASASDGVTCPGGYDATFSSGVMKCRKPVTQTATTICPVLFPNYRVRGERDVCTNIASIELPYLGPITIDTTKMAYPVPAALGNSWQIQINGDTGDRDRFTRQVYEYVYPNGHPTPYLGDATQGVKCPTGSSASFNDSANRLVCSKAQDRVAVCLGLYALDVNDGTDRCLLAFDVRPTVPEGELSSNGWSLDVNGPSGGSVRDHWRKTSYQYATSLF